MTDKLFRVAARGPASILFRKGQQISVNYERDGNLASVVLATRYRDNQDGVPIAGQFSAVIDAPAASADSAITWVTVARELASIVAVAGNASIGEIEGELAYEISPGVGEREFFQRFVPADEMTLTSRTVPMEASCALIAAIEHHPDRDRLLRAVMQYDRAVRLWALGNELLVVAHLFMGVEALKVAALRQHLAAKGISKEELGAEWGYKPKGGYMTLDSYLEAAARVHLVCEGDKLHHDIARRVSDSFEHGLKNGGELFEEARDTLVPTARHLRRSILRVAGVGDEHVDVMTSDRYATPRGPGGFEQYFRTTLVGDGDQLSETGYDHPMCEWTHDMESAELDPETWTYSVKPNHTLTARLGPGIKMIGGSYEIWDGGRFTPQCASEKAADPRSEEAVTR